MKPSEEIMDIVAACRVLCGAAWSRVRFADNSVGRTIENISAPT